MRLFHILWTWFDLSHITVYPTDESVFGTCVISKIWNKLSERCEKSQPISKTINVTTRLQICIASCFDDVFSLPSSSFVVCIVHSLLFRSLLWKGENKSFCFVRLHVWNANITRTNCFRCRINCRIYIVSCESWLRGRKWISHMVQANTTPFNVFFYLFEECKIALSPAINSRSASYFFFLFVIIINIQFGTKSFENCYAGYFCSSV